VALMGLATRIYTLMPLAVYVPMGLYLILGLLSLTYAPSLASAGPKIIEWLNFIAVMLVVTTLRPSLGIVKAAVATFLLVEVALGGLAIATTLSTGIDQAGLYLLDFHKNALGVYMAMAVPILLARFLWPLDSRTRRQTLLLLVPVGAGLILSGSRGAWAGALFACALLGFYRGRRFGAAALGAVAVVILVGNALLPEALTRVDEIVSGTGTVEGRYIVWQEAWQTYTEHPLLGLGIGSYVSHSQHLGQIGDYNVTDPHNIILRLLVELGPLGLLCFLWILALIAAQARRNSQTLGTPELQALNAGLMAAMAAYIGAAMFGPAFQRGHGTLFFLFAGLVFLLPSLDAARAPIPKGLASRIARRGFL
jgi:O-antigen ligase